MTGTLRLVEGMPEQPNLARAFLALVDDPEPPEPARSLPRVVCALAASVALALAAPLAWASARDLPPAAPAAKAGAPAEAEDDEPWPDA